MTHWFQLWRHRFRVIDARLQLSLLPCNLRNRMNVRVRTIDARVAAVLGVIVLLAAQCAASAIPNSGRPVPRPPAIATVNPAPVITPIQFVQINSATPQTSQTPVTARFASTQTAGDLNVVVVSWNDSAATIQSVSTPPPSPPSAAIKIVIGFRAETPTCGSMMRTPSPRWG